MSFTQVAPPVIGNHTLYGAKAAVIRLETFACVNVEVCEHTPRSQMREWGSAIFSWSYSAIN